jgi:nucleoside-diphosphate-sugar epimerase
VNVLITGAGGFIGQHLVADQLRRGRHVTALDLNTKRLAPLADQPRLRLVQGDFTRADVIDPLLAEQAVCFHLASAHLETRADEAFFQRINVAGARDLAERAHRAGVGRFVHCSSVGVYGDLKQPPVDETAACHPDIAYERSKLAGEQAVQAFAQASGWPVVILRPAWVYGPGCPRTLKLFRAIRRGRFFHVGSSRHTLRHPLYIDDMVAGFECAAVHPAAPGQVFVMAGPRPVTLAELASEIAACLGVPEPRLWLPFPLVWAACVALELGFGLAGRAAPFSRRSLKFYTGNTAFHTRRARAVLGFEASVDFRPGIQRTYQGLAEQL